ncbi:hypothetical protein WEI85_10320 [Actinomycetes bacterium KLBMP 9797]
MSRVHMSQQDTLDGAQRLPRLVELSQRGPAALDRPVLADVIRDGIEDLRASEDKVACFSNYPSLM